MRTSIGMAAAVLLPALVAGCFNGYVYAPTTGNVASAKQPNCRFEILRTRPDRAFVELGALDIQGDASAAPHDVPTFRKLIQRRVCKAGGDAVLADVSGFGAYVKGTVIKYGDDVESE